jgi:glyoxylate reductase
MTHRVFITQRIPEPAASLLKQAGYDVTSSQSEGPLSHDALRAAVAQRDAVLCLLTDKIDAEILEAARGCKIFANMAVGYNNIDLVAAAERDIIISNTPGVLTEATADLAWTLILGVARRVSEGDGEMRAGRFPGWGPLYMLGGDVTGSALGLIGPGRIAAAVAKRALGFDMNILYAGHRPSPAIDALGGRLVALDQLLRESDFVSLHVPLTADTRHLIDARALGLMKSSAYLINTARGPVVDELALVQALKLQRIAGAGLDVYEHEPRMVEGLAECPNTLLLPHLGSATKATRGAMSRIAAENVLAVLRGEPAPNRVVA